MKEAHTHTPHKITFTFIDAEGEWHAMPLEYNKELSEHTTRFTTSTDLFGLLNKDSLQNIFIEIIVE